MLVAHLTQSGKSLGSTRCERSGWKAAVVEVYNRRHKKAPRHIASARGLGDGVFELRLAVPNVSEDGTPLPGVTLDADPVSVQLVEEVPEERKESKD